MKVNIYYGGRGLIDDPTILVINKIQEVLEELNVIVTRYNLYEMKNTITTLPQTLKEIDAVVLATTVEWLGIGGYMQLFLDACWLYGDKSKMSDIYMVPVVMSKTYGEKEAVLTLTNSWDMLGGKPVSGLAAYVDDMTEFEFNKGYIEIIEKQAENIYRTVSQKARVLPTSNATIKQSVLKDTIRLTPQESEQLSKFAADDVFVKTQKEDIESLANIYKEMLTDEENGGDVYYIQKLESKFNKNVDFKGTYMIIISDKDINIIADINNSRLSVSIGDKSDTDVVCKMSKSIFDSIAEGRITFQRAFMTGDMTAKGNFKNIRMLDEVFKF